jgi:hypothetical protein
MPRYLPVHIFLFGEGSLTGYRTSREVLVLISVDVGLHGLAFAAWDEGALTAAWYTAASQKGRGAEAWRRLVQETVNPALAGCDLLVETMVHYQGSRTDPADLLELQGIAGALVMAVPWASVENVEARTWTEGVPKEVRHARLDLLLEQRGWTAAIDAPKPRSRMVDVLDAVGLGLWWTSSRSTRRWRVGADAKARY